VLSVVAAESNQLLAYRTATVGLPLAHLGVLHHPLHLLAAGKPAVGISALTSVHQRLNASLNGQFSRLLQQTKVSSYPNPKSESEYLWIGLSLISGRGAVIEVQAELLHFVLVAVPLVTIGAKVKVLRSKLG
jgi:hypothetical protein